MGRVASGQERVDRVEKKQKNGSVYIYERRSRYDSSKGYYVSVGQKLIGKKLPGSDQIVPTRSKLPNGTIRKSAAEPATQYGGVSATRNRIGAVAIVDHIGKISGIDEDIYKSCPEVLADRIIAVARYYLISDGEPKSHIENWQILHELLPLKERMDEKAVGRLYKIIGQDESISQSVFFHRASHLSDVTTLAYDSTTFSTYGSGNPRARYGYNKDKDGLPADKLFTFYSMETRQPICYTVETGDVSDIVAVNKAIKELNVLGLKGAELVTDCGFCSEDNLSDLFQGLYHFLTRVADDLKWIRPEIDKVLQNIEDIGNMAPFEPGTYGITVCLTHEFKKTRKYGSSKKGLKAGDVELFTRRVFLHIYVNDSNKVKESADLDIELARLRKQYLEGIREFKPAAQKKINDFLVIGESKKGNIDIKFNIPAIRQAKKYHGVFVLASNYEKDTFAALAKYRRREWIEDFFEEYKNRIGGKKNREWDGPSLDGKRLVQFIALSYYEYFSKMINEMKESLGKKNGDHDHDLKKNLDMEIKLKNWLERTSIQEIFECYDAIEKIEVATPVGREMWTTDRIAMFNMFLKKLGMRLPDDPNYI